jgi:hypothetical protein
MPGFYSCFSGAEARIAGGGIKEEKKGEKEENRIMDAGRMSEAG